MTNYKRKCAHMFSDWTSALPFETIVFSASKPAPEIPAEEATVSRTSFLRGDREARVSS
jgi:hypothetical protein